MKKLLLIGTTLILLAGCGNSLNVDIPIENPVKNDDPYSYEISSSGEYTLNCRTHYYFGAVIGGNLIKESYIKAYEGHERDSLYVRGDNAQYFGGEYIVIQDDSEYLVIMRHAVPSGVSETVSINKNSGIGFDTKTLTLGISGAPTTDTYILSCNEI